MSEMFYKSFRCHSWGEAEMNAADKSIALKAIDLIIEYYLPSIRGHAPGGAMHSLYTWQMIREIVEKYEAKEG